MNKTAKFIIAIVVIGIGIILLGVSTRSRYKQACVTDFCKYQSLGCFGVAGSIGKPKWCFNPPKGKGMESREFPTKEDCFEYCEQKLSEIGY